MSTEIRRVLRKHIMEVMYIRPPPFQYAHSITVNTFVVNGFKLRILKNRNLVQGCSVFISYCTLLSDFYDDLAGG